MNRFFFHSIARHWKKLIFPGLTSTFPGHGIHQGPFQAPEQDVAGEAHRSQIFVEIFEGQGLGSCFGEVFLFGDLLGFLGMTMGLDLFFEIEIWVWNMLSFFLNHVKASMTEPKTAYFGVNNGKWRWWSMIC